jgi:hypothetical protein
MATNPIQSGNPFQELSRLFAETADANRDGQVSQDEFATFLTNLLRSLNTLPTNSQAAPANNTLPAARPTVLSSLSALPLASESNRPHMSGYSQTKLADATHDTPKYLFGRLAQNIDLSSVVDKESAEALLLRMRPELEAAGLEILNVERDRIQIMEGEEPVWIDVIRGAESGSPAFQWFVAAASPDSQRAPLTATDRGNEIKKTQGDGDASKERT